jgi:hypothetical protein
METKSESKSGDWAHAARGAGSPYGDDRWREACAGAALTKRRLTKAEAADERATAIHEAAHGCVAIALRIKFTKIVIHDDDPETAGQIHYSKKAHSRFWQLLLQEGQHQDPTVIDFVERKIVTSFAGAAAQRRYAPRSDWRDSSRGDRKGVDKWLQKLIAGPSNYEGHVPARWERERSDYYDDETGDFYGDIEPKRDDDAFWYTPDRLLSRKTLDAYHAKYEARARVLVRELWPDIQRVAKALLKKKVLTQSQVRRLMNRARRRGRELPKKESK